MSAACAASGGGTPVGSTRADLSPGPSPSALPAAAPALSPARPDPSLRHLSQGAELRRAVDYFSVEASKDKSKISRLKNEGVVLEKKLKDLEASIMGNSPSILISLLDKVGGRGVDVSVLWSHGP